MASNADRPPREPPCKPIEEYGGPLTVGGTHNVSERINPDRIVPQPKDAPKRDI